MKVIPICYQPYARFYRGVRGQKQSITCGFCGHRVRGKSRSYDEMKDESDGSRELGRSHPGRREVEPESQDVPDMQLHICRSGPRTIPE